MSQLVRQRAGVVVPPTDPAVTPLGLAGMQPSSSYTSKQEREVSIAAKLPLPLPPALASAVSAEPGAGAG